MLKPIHVEDSLKIKNKLFIDVRSPSEFQESTIPGAVNIPILDDEERAQVGTVYRQESPEKATILGLDFAAPKLSRIYGTIQEYARKYDAVIVFCWRGGMRSKSVCSFLDMLHVANIYQLVGGYKAYRKYVVDFLDQGIERFRFVMLHGLTGVGKTYILEKLKALGQPVLDLERMAQNSGSVFGDIVFEGTPPTQKTFESRIFDTLYAIKEDYVFVESESKRIGNVQVPDSLYNRMIGGFHILIHTSMENRIHTILQDYVEHLDGKNHKIINAILHLRKRLSNDVVSNLIGKIENKDYIYVIKYLFEHYYDPLYQYSIDKYKPYDLVIDYGTMEDAVTVLQNFVKTI